MNVLRTLAFFIFSGALSSAALAAAIPQRDFAVKSVFSVDTATHSAVFPIHRGTAAGKTVWYILTDSSDAGVARAQGLVYAPALAKLGNGIVDATRSGDVVLFPAAPDFSPVRTYVASESGFPPKSATPGATASADYSPFVRIAGQSSVFNAPIIATGDGPFDVTTHTNTADRVVAIDVEKQTATLALARGFADGKALYYLSTEASDPVAAAVERAVYAPRLAKAADAGAIPIGVIANGPVEGPNAQGLAFLTLRTPLGQDATAANAATIGSPFNVLSLAPDLKKPYAANAYSPLWSAEVGAWTDAAEKKHPKIVKSFSTFAVAAAQGDITGPGGKAFAPVGFVINCPVIAYGGGDY